MVGTRTEDVNVTVSDSVRVRDEVRVVWNVVALVVVTVKDKVSVTVAV